MTLSAENAYSPPDAQERRNLALPAAVFLFTVALIALLAWGLLRGKPTLVKVSGPAPDFTLTTFDGKTVHLADLKGRPVMINFWASWCPPCREEAPVLERTWQSYREKGVVILGVDIQDTDKDARAFLSEFRLTYPNARDVTGEVSIDYGVTGVPETFFIDRDGNLAQKYLGAVKEPAIVSILDGLLAKPGASSSN